MGLETSTYIDGLVPTNPSGKDQLSQADDHLRLIKSTLKNTFPNINGQVDASEEELNKNQVRILARTSSLSELVDDKDILSFPDIETNEIPEAITTDTRIEIPDTAGTYARAKANWSGDSSGSVNSTLGDLYSIGIVVNSDADNKWSTWAEVHLLRSNQTLVLGAWTRWVPLSENRVFEVQFLTTDVGAPLTARGEAGLFFEVEVR